MRRNIVDYFSMFTQLLLLLVAVMAYNNSTESTDLTGTSRPHKYTRERLYNYRGRGDKNINARTIITLKELNILHYRGSRGGQHRQRPIPTIIGKSRARP